MVKEGIIAILIGLLIFLGILLRNSEIEVKRIKKELNKIEKDKEFREKAYKIIDKYTNMSKIKKDIIIDSILYSSEKYKVDKYMILKIIAVESNFCERAKSRVGAKGLMQLMDKTFKWVVKKNRLKCNNIWGISDNIEVGTCYFKMLCDRFGNFEDALGFYNAGRHYKKYYKRYIKKIKKIDKLLED